MKKDFYHSLFEILEKKEPVLLATIISQHGSSPRGTGAHMALTANGSQIGTIGGGRIEAIFHERFKDLVSINQSSIFDFILSESEASNLEMICGGSISILVDSILPEDKNLIELFHQVSDTTQNQTSGWIVSLLPSEGKSQMPEKCFISADGFLYGSWRPKVTFNGHLPEKLFDNYLEIQLSELDLKSPQIIKVGENKIFWEPVGQHSSVYIVGAGHIAQKLAPLTTLVGFRTIILDDRQEFISSDRFPTVDERHILADFSNVFDTLKIDSQSYIVIVTRGHQFDKSVLGQALSTDASYIGMIGSRRKIKLTFESLINEGCDEKKLARVHSPIGLDIGAETPEEIAVSIVAELIKCRAQT